MSPVNAVLSIVGMLVKAIIWIIIIDAILTWFPQIDRRNPIVLAIRRITEPIYRPIRRLVPPEKTGYIDLSPLIAIILIQLVWMVVVRIAFAA